MVLVSRCNKKLQNVAKQIGESLWKQQQQQQHGLSFLWFDFNLLPRSEGEYGRKTRTIQADFTDGNTIYSAVAHGLQGLEVGILGKCTCHIFTVTRGILCILETRGTILTADSSPAGMLGNYLRL